MRKGRIVHGASLTWLLFFCKWLSSEPFPFGRSQSKSSSLLGETEVLLAVGRRFADHHSALAQILEMGKGRKASGTRQGRVQADIDPGDERRNRPRAVGQRGPGRDFALAPGVDERPD